MIQRMTKTKEPISREDACRLLHVALRKACDSKPTTIAYNVIGLVCALEIKPRALDPWLVLGELIADTYNKPIVGSIGPFDVKECVDRLDDEWWSRNKRRRDKGQPSPDNAQPALNALTSTFRMFNDNDWRGMASYLLDDEDD